MTQLGEIKRGYEIGKKGWEKYIWSSCPKCGKTKWSFMLGDKPRFPLCHNCGNRHPREPYKGGRCRSGLGYVSILVRKDDFFFPMVGRKGSRNTNYVPEHRLVMAKHLKRCLLPWEIVHHKNGIRDDNRLENLELIPTMSDHMRGHTNGYGDGYKAGFADGANKKIKELEAIIEELGGELKGILEAGDRG